MSKFLPGVLGAAALAVSLGAAQFAVGRDLGADRAVIAAAAQSNSVNRIAKADRPEGITPVLGQTIVTRLSALDDTSLAIRVARPTQTLLRDGKASAKSARRPVACEAPASVLSEVAQHMESGRCLT